MNTFKYIGTRTLKTLLLGALAFLLARPAYSQSCKQVEILHQSPECLSDTGGTAGTPDRKDCTPIAVCLNQPYTYTAAGIWSSYLWTATGPAAVTISPSNTPSVSITWPATGVYTLTLTVTDPAGNVFTNCLTVTVKDKPVANFTFTPNNVCAGSTITFTNTSTSTGSTIYNWNFGDPPSGANNTATTTNVATTVSHIYNTPGTFTVTLIASTFTVVTTTGPQGDRDSVIKTCCSDTITKTVTIVPGTLKIECISTVCAGDTATYHVVGCAGVTWLPPVGGIILAQTPTSITIQWGNGAVQGQIVALCPGGCTASVAVPIIPQNPQPVGNLSPCFNSTTSYSLPSLPGTFYNWQLKNITTNTLHNGALSTYPDNNTVLVNWTGLPAGTYELTVNLNNKHICCSSTGKITITPKDKFAAFSDQTICAGNFASLGVFPFTGGFTWTVLPPNTGASPLTGAGTSFAPGFANAGVYYVQVYETANTYCNSGIANAQVVKVTVVSTPSPGSITGPTTVCPGGTYNYSTSTPAPAGYYYSWTITGGTGCFQPGCLPTITGNTASILWTGLTGTISISLQRSSTPPCPSPAVTLSVTQAVIGTPGGPVNVCVDDVLGYSLTGGNLPPGEDVQWTITPSSLGTITAGQGTSSPTILWHGVTGGSGPWTAFLTATSACGSTSPPYMVTISKKPIFTLSQSGDICLGTVTLNATPGYTYVWKDPSNVIISTSSTATATVPGPYTVTVTNGSCSVTRSITVVKNFIVAPVGCMLGYCNGSGTNEQLGVQVIQPGSGTFTYQWYSGVFPGGSLMSTNTTTSTSDNYLATADGDYYVIVTYGSCQERVDYVVKKICCPDINDPKIVSTVYESCDSVTFTGTTPNPTGASITWNFGDGTSAPGVSGVPIGHHYSLPGKYCVTFCVGPPTPNSTNCTGNCAVTTVTIPLRAAFGYTLGCNGCINITNFSTVLSVSGTPPVVNYIWDFGDGTIIASGTPAPPAHCYTPGSYTLTLTINYTDPGVPLSCTSTFSVPVNYTALSITMPTPVCSGQQIPMSSNPGGFASYVWDFGDGYSAFTPSTTHIYSSPGSYTVQLTVTDLPGNTCTATQNVTVYPGIGSSCTVAPASICPGGTATLTVTGGLGTYLWQVETTPGNFVPAPGVNTNNTYTVTAPGFYRVIITNAFGCTCISKPTEVKAAPKPKALIAASTTQLCGSGNVTLSTPILPGHTYAWYANVVPGPVLSAGPVYNAFGVTITTNFILVVTNEYGCTDTCQLTVKVSPIPAAPIIVFAPSLCEGVPVLLTVTNYVSNITWNNGAATTSITVSAAGSYTATYTDPVSGCTKSNSIVVNKRPPTDLFPHFCDSIPCNCRKDTLFAPRPLIGTFAAPLNIQWFYNGVPSGTGPFKTPAPAGSYHIVVTDLSTGCKDTSDTYSIVVPPCDTCGCANSHWGEIILTGNNQQQVLQCNTAVTIDCNKPYTVNASFFCAGNNCPPKVTYSLTQPAGPVLTGNAPLTFTPSSNGIYVLKLYGWCGTKICDSCTINFQVTNCPTNCNCTGSHWGDIILTGNNQQLGLQCNTTKVLDCNKPYTVNASFFCADGNCPPKVTYSLTQPSGPALTGNAPLTFTPTQTGLYTLKLYGWCGTKICDSCTIQFEVYCPPCDCAGSKWGEIILETPQGQQMLGCGKEVFWNCKIPFTLNATYLCANANLCPSKVTYSLQPPTGPAITGNAPLSYTPMANGAYVITLYGWCGTKICDSCTITVFVEDCIECDCEQSHWGDIILTGMGQQQGLSCGKEVNWFCNNPFTVNAGYDCPQSDECPPLVTYSLQPPTGPAVTGTAPLTYTPTLPGTYTLTLYGWCGNKICDSCVIKFIVNCDPGCDCQGSFWGDKYIGIGQNLKPLTCGHPEPLECNQPYTVNANYICADATCTGAVQYKLTGPAGTSTGAVPFTFTPTITGTYTLTLYGYCGTTLCDSCVIPLLVQCAPPPCCHDSIVMGNPLIQTGTLTNPPATVVNASFPLTGLPGVQYTGIKAEVVDYQLSDNFEGTCLRCDNLPYTWASMYQGGNIGAITPVITMFSGTVPVFNPSGAGQYQNPGEIRWVSNTPFTLPPVMNLSFLIPPPPLITCCEVTAKICVKFTFRNKDCSICEVVVCFNVMLTPPANAAQKVITGVMKKR
jgi:PKD repeat protein